MEDTNVSNTGDTSSLGNRVGQVEFFTDRFLVWGKDAYDLVVQRYSMDTG